MPHIIGNGLSYDADMILIDSFVRAKNDVDNVVAQTAVFSYYISQAYNYWEILKENLLTIEVDDSQSVDLWFSSSISSSKNVTSTKMDNLSVIFANYPFKDLMQLRIKKYNIRREDMISKVES